MFDDSDRPLDPENPAPAEPAPDPNSASTRFKACRFHAEKDGREFCSNRDVLPYAGKGGFDPEAWCPDCTLYKLRRTPKKRPRLDDNTDYQY